MNKIRLLQLQLAIHCSPSFIQTEFNYQILNNYGIQLPPASQPASQQQQVLILLNRTISKYSCRPSKRVFKQIKIKLKLKLKASTVCRKKYI